MAKARAQSKHSRAARRAASPSLDVDKSLTSLPRVEETTPQRDSILTDRANAGVGKKQSKGKVLSRAQRLRQQKGMDRAEAVLDQLEIKVGKSVKRGKAVDARRAEWEDMNRKSTAARFEALNNVAEDENDDDMVVDDSAAPRKTRSQARAAQVAQNPVADEPAAIDEDDVID